MGSLGERIPASAPVRRAPRFVSVVAAAILAIVALTAVGNPASAQHHGGDADGILPEGDWSDDQVAYAVDPVERTEEALPAFSQGDTYEEITAALIEMGYVDFGPAPDDYDHWIDVDRMRDDKLLDPTAPESLVFHQTDEGFELVSAMFFLNDGDTMEDIPEDLRWLPGWHVHPDVCTDDQMRFTGLTSPGSPCSSGSPILTPMLHVWIVDNECGHRFGGVDIGGLHCDVHGHPGGDEEPPPDQDPGGNDGDDGHGDDGHEDGDHDDMGHEPPEAPPAQPVTATPHFTG